MSDSQITHPEVSHQLSDSIDVTNEQIISRVSDSLRFLERLGTAEAIKLLDRVKNKPNPLYFSFQS
jgi:hypothetical protein